MDSKYYKNLKLQQIPVLHVRGTHREVGYAIGRTFKNLFDDVIKKYDFLEDLLMPNYKTARGQEIFKSTLHLCQEKFPGYVEELQGISDGCEIPFYKLFLLQIETQIVPSSTTEADKFAESKLETGCSCVLSYPDKDTILLGHTEDARKELRNNVFILDAEIIGNKSGESLEKFATLCYSCSLPGFTMGYNDQGLFHSMNTLVPSNICPEKTPVGFITRALLGAKSLDKAMDILRDSGTGTADGFSVNFVYAPSGMTPKIRNVEVAPNPGKFESRLDVFEIGLGESYAHCNKYIRMDVEQQNELVIGSEKRLEAIGKYNKPYQFEDIGILLSDRSHPMFPVFRGSGELEKEVGLAATVTVGIFDILNKKWFIYTGPPENSSPVAILPIHSI